jgi:hypothetical protein
MDTHSYRFGSDSEDALTAEQIVTTKLRLPKITASKDNSQTHLKTKNRNKLDNDNSENPYDVPFEITKQDLNDSDSGHIIPNSLKIQKILKRE